MLKALLFQNLSLLFMKKFSSNLLTAIFLTILSVQAKAQENAFENNAVYISAGYGVGTFTKSLFDTYSVGNTGYSFTSKGPFFAKIGFSTSEKLEFGFNFAYAGADIQYDVDQNIVGNIDWSAWSLMGRLNLHLGNSKKFDPYWGIGFGYRVSSWDFRYSDPNYSETQSLKSPIPLAFETTFGARYLVTKNIGAYAEVGISKAMLQFGLVAKIK